MKVYAQFICNGYASPYPDDYEVFSSIKRAKEELNRRFKGWCRCFPCVDESAAFCLFAGPPAEQDSYPDYILSIGPRGAVRQERIG